MPTISIPAPIVDGDYVEAESAKLSDPDGDYGIREVVSGDVIVADGEDLTFVNGDSYEYEFEGEDGVSYEAWFEIVYDGETYWSNVIVDGGGEILASKTLRFCVIKEGELVALEDYPRLSSPSGGYGVKNMAGGATVVEDGAAMGPEAGGTVFARTFSDDPEGSKYKFYVEVEVDDVVYFVPGTTKMVSSAMLAIGRYTDSTKIGQRFGEDNQHLWLSNAIDDGDEPVDYARRAYQFIVDAEAELDAMLLGVYVSGAFEETIPPTIVRLATDMAGVAMYEARGVDDINAETGEAFHRLRYTKKNCEATIRKIKLGLMTISGSASVVPNPLPSAGGFDLADLGDDESSS